MPCNLDKTLSYPQSLKQLLEVNIQGGIKLGLENMRRLDALLGNPSQAFPSIHIAGTNGKGSVSTKIATSLQDAGMRTALYTSPHISTFRERIRINGTMIPQDIMARHLAAIFDLTKQHQIPATFFEIATLLAFKYFSEQQVDIAVIETGLGGRFDATNILKTKLSVITSISIEHTEYLGTTIEEIAKEKAGIIKPNTPVVLGRRLPVEIFAEKAKALKSHFTQVQGEHSDFCQENEAIARHALQLLEIPEKAIEKGLQALPPCRVESIDLEKLPFVLEKTPPDIILDVAHNPDGLSHLLKTLKTRYPNNKNKFRFVIGLSKSKDLTECFKTILKETSHLHLVEARNGRAASIDMLKSSLDKLNVPPSLYTASNTISEAIYNAAIEAGNNGEILIICGTFFIMSEARAALGIIEERDPDDMNER